MQSYNFFSTFQPYIPLKKVSILPMFYFESQNFAIQDIISIFGNHLIVNSN